MEAVRSISIFKLWKEDDSDVQTRGSANILDFILMMDINSEHVYDAEYEREKISSGF